MGFSVEANSQKPESPVKGRNGSRSPSRHLGSELELGVGAELGKMDSRRLQGECDPLNS